MYKIYIKKENGWLEIEISNQSLEDVILRVIELEKSNSNEIYRLEEITEIGTKVINLN